MLIFLKFTQRWASQRMITTDSHLNKTTLLQRNLSPTGNIEFPRIEPVSEVRFDHDPNEDSNTLSTKPSL